MYTVCMYVSMYVGVCACVRACVRACVVCVCVFRRVQAGCVSRYGV